MSILAFSGGGWVRGAYYRVSRKKKWISAAPRRHLALESLKKWTRRRIWAMSFPGGLIAAGHPRAGHIAGLSSARNPTTGAPDCGNTATDGHLSLGRIASPDGH